MKRPPDHASDPVSSTSLFNIANGLTFLRLLAVPVVGYLLFVDTAQARNVAALVFLLASLTDVLDGFVARRYGLITNFGKIADPIADKFLTGVALVGLSALGLLPWWISIVIIAREVIVTIIRFWVIEHGVISASRGGKAKTLTQTVAITMYLVVIPETSSLASTWDLVRALVMGIAVILTVVTAIYYFQQAISLRRLTRSGGGD